MCMTCVETESIISDTVINNHNHNPSLQVNSLAANQVAKIWRFQSLTPLSISLAEFVIRNDIYIIMSDDELCKY